MPEKQQGKIGKNNKNNNQKKKRKKINIGDHATGTHIKQKKSQILTFFAKLISRKKKYGKILRSSLNTISH